MACWIEKSRWDNRYFVVLEFQDEDEVEIEIDTNPYSLANRYDCREQFMRDFPNETVPPSWCRGTAK